MPNNVTEPPSQRIRILTVGDGDFSGSLAILRAYRQHIEELVATSLISSREELLEVYPGAKEVLRELDSSNGVAKVLFGVDATSLHQDPRLMTQGDRPFDYIIFQHPHIGHEENGTCSTLQKRKEEESSSIDDPENLPRYALLVRKHSSLVAHYLYSSRGLIRQQLKLGRGDESGFPPTIHLCLCAGQSKSWKLERHLRRLRLKYSEKPRFASKPLWPHLEGSSSEADSESRTSYWLSRFGYQHQATVPSTTQLSQTINSHHHFFRLDTESDIPQVDKDAEYLRICSVCSQEHCGYRTSTGKEGQR